MSEYIKAENGRLVSVRAMGELSIVDLKYVFFAQFSNHPNQPYEFWSEQFKTLERAKAECEAFYRREKFVSLDDQYELGF